MVSALDTVEALRTRPGSVAILARRFNTFGGAALRTRGVHFTKVINIAKLIKNHRIRKSIFTSLLNVYGFFRSVKIDKKEKKSY